MEEKLIETVREHRVLFDPAHKKYMDFNHKSVLWNKIASQCGFNSGKHARDFWKKLRDAYRSSLKRKKSNCNAAGNRYTWKYDDLMSFLQPYMKDRKRNTSEIAVRAIETEILMEECKNEERTEASSSQQAFPSKKEINVLEYSQNEERKKELRSSEREHVRRNVSKPEDGLKLFFDSMYAATITMPSHLQKKVKRGLFNVVAEAEDEAELYCNYSSNVASPDVNDQDQIYTNLDVNIIS